MRVYLDNCCFNRPFDDRVICTPITFALQLESQ